MTNEREAFEAKFPVPDGVQYVESENYYISSSHLMSMRLQNTRWEAWQAALKEMQSRQGEAVAWRLKIDGEWIVDDCYEWVMQKGADNAGAIESEIEPLYTHPPSQPVELTDEQKKDVTECVSGIANLIAADRKLRGG